MKLGNNIYHKISFYITPIHVTLATDLECESFMKIRLYNMIYDTLSLNTNYNIIL